jgi:hypothetical protein
VRRVEALHGRRRGRRGRRSVGAPRREGGRRRPRRQRGAVASVRRRRRRASAQRRSVGGRNWARSRRCNPSHVRSAPAAVITAGRRSGCTVVASRRSAVAARRLRVVGISRRRRRLRWRVAACASSGAVFGRAPRRPGRRRRHGRHRSALQAQRARSERVFRLRRNGAVGALGPYCVLRFRRPWPWYTGRAKTRALRHVAHPAHRSCAAACRRPVRRARERRARRFRAGRHPDRRQRIHRQVRFLHRMHLAMCTRCARKPARMRRTAPQPRARRDDAVQGVPWTLHLRQRCARSAARMRRAAPQHTVRAARCGPRAGLGTDAPRVSTPRSASQQFPGLDIGQFDRSGFQQTIGNYFVSRSSCFAPRLRVHADHPLPFRRTSTPRWCRSTP